MQVIPAIDIRAGKCVRLLQGQADQQTVYGDDPVAMAQRWVDAGAPRLHIVDLDGAFDGHMGNFTAIARIAQSVSVPVQLGGGIRDLDTIQKVLDAGVQRVVLGTAAVEQPDMLATAAARLPGQICVGIDSRQGKVAVHGWQTLAEVDPIAFAQHVAQLGVAAIIYTDISRDGMLQGPNIAGITMFAEALDVPVIASGGVSQLVDLERLATLTPLGVEAAIVGKALYDGHFTYQQALAIGARSA